MYVCAVLEVPDVGVNKKADNDMRIRLPLHCGFLPQEGVDIIFIVCSLKKKNVKAANNVCEDSI